MSGYHDPRGGDRYAPARPGPRDPLPPSSSRAPPAPPSGPSRGGLPPSSSSGPPSAPSRHPSHGRGGYDAAPRGPRYEAAPPQRSYDPTPPPAPSRPQGRLSLWSTQNPGGRDGYHHSGAQSQQARNFGPLGYRDHDRYESEYRPQRYSSSSSARDPYLQPGPRGSDSHRGDSRLPSSSSYYPNYSASPSPPTGPRHGHPAYHPPRPPPEKPRSRERTPSGPSGWPGPRPVPPDKRFHEPILRRDHSPPSIPQKPRSPDRDETKDIKDTVRHPEIKTIVHKPSTESLTESRTASRALTPEPMEDIKATEIDKVDQEAETEEEEGEALTQDDVDQRIRAIDFEMRSVAQRIEAVEAQKAQHELQLRLLRKDVPDITDLKREETEEDMTPREVPTPTLQPLSLPKLKKRPRSPEPSVEPSADEEDEHEEDEKENIRVKIWRLLKKSEIKHGTAPELNERTKLLLLDDNLPMKVINSVDDLSDAEESANLHRENRHAIFRALYIRRKRQTHRQEKFRRKYHQRYLLWQAHMSQLDAARAAEMERMGLGAPKPEAPPTPRTEVIPPPTPMSEVVTPADGLVRGTRRAQQAAHARDYVQSEAEFLELMQSLGTEEKTPTATIPPMLHPEDRACLDFDETGLIANPIEFYSRALTTVDQGTKMDVTGWSEEDDKIFLRRLAVSGKQFGKFRRAQQLAHRSVQELVQHYYFLKGDGMGMDWRNVIAGKNRWGGRVARSSAPGALMSTGAPRVNRGGRPRKRGRGGVSALLPRRGDDGRITVDDDGFEETRSAMDDDGDDSGSVTTERARRTAKSRIIESTAAKQRPKRTGPVLIKEKVPFC